MKRLPSARRDHLYTHMPTRHDFSQMAASEIVPGLIIRSLHIPKWEVKDAAEFDTADLMRIPRSQLACGSESALPKKFVVTHARKPRWVLVEL